MLQKNIAIRGIFTTILFITMGASQVSLEIKNVDTGAGTLDIYMTNVSGCSYCPDSTYNNNTQNWIEKKNYCELSSAGDTTWVSYDNSYTEAECWSWCSGVIIEGSCTGADDPAVADFSQPDNEADCLDPAGDNNATGTLGTWESNSNPDGSQPNNEAKCLDPAGDNNATGTPGTWSQSTISSLDGNGGWWFDGEVSGFQFQLFGASIDGAGSGSAEDNGFIISAQATTYNAETDTQLPNILAYSITGATIPAGAGVLVSVLFSNFEGQDICFGEDTGSAGANTVSDTYTGTVINTTTGGYIAADWGGCYCGGSASQNDADGDSICNDDDTCPYDEYNDADGDGVCGDTDECLDTPAGETAYTSGDSLGCSASQWSALSISQISTYMPDEFAISQNFPNPFNPVTSITFDVAEMDEVSLIVYDLTGKEVATLVSGTYTPGTYNVEWNAVNNAGDGIVSGMYIYRYISSEKAITRKMLYLK